MSKWDVEFHLLKATGFKKKPLTSLTPYILVKCQTQCLRSVTLKGVDGDADWSQHKQCFTSDEKLYEICDNSLITFELYDENVIFRHKYMGAASKSLHELMKISGEEHTIEFMKQGKDDPRGKLTFRLDVVAAAATARPGVPGKRFLPQVSSTPNGVWIFGQTEPLGSKYQLGQKLGEGAFGITKKATRKGTTEVFACKSIAKSKLTTPEAVGDVKREIEVMHHLTGHPNVVRLEEVFEDATHVHIVMELCRGGNLYEHIISRGNYTEGDIAKLMHTIMSVVAKCHEMNVLHRDLKPENFLLAEPYDQKTKTVVLKATDFGLSTFARVGQKFAEVVGTCYYIAPEVLKRAGGQEADVWSAGVIMYILLSGRPPYGGANETQVFKNIMHSPLDLKGRLWALVSKQGKDLLKSMLDKDPAKRPTAVEVLKHIWFRAEGAWQQQMDPELFTRMKVFAEANLLKKLTLLWLADDVRRVEVAGLDAMFEDMDLNEDNQLSKEELEMALKKRGSSLTVDMVTELVSKVDMNADGMVNRQEFIAAALSLKRLDSNKIRQAFKKFDLDGDDKLSTEELEAALQKTSFSRAHDVEVILDQADTNKDGVIDYTEFREIVRATGTVDSDTQPTTPTS